MDNNQNNYYNDPYNTNSNGGTNYYHTPNQTYPAVEQPKKKNIAFLVLSIVSLVCGVYSILFSILYGIGIIFAIPGIITRNIAIKKNNGISGSMAKAGLITSIIGLILSILSIIIFACVIAYAIINGESTQTYYHYYSY